VIGPSGALFERISRLAVGVPDLEAQAALVFVHGFAEILDFAAIVALVGLVAGHGEQGLGGLGQLGVEQFIDLVVSVEVAENHGHQPGRGDAAEQQAEQAATQREPDGVHLPMV
jgi:hypothetical protein